LDFFPGAIPRGAIPPFFDMPEDVQQGAPVVAPKKWPGGVQLWFFRRLGVYSPGKTVCDGTRCWKKILSPTQMKDFGRKFVVKKDQKDLPILLVRDLFWGE